MSGLFSAAFLRQIGWDVDVYERSNVELVGRGAGITTHPELLDALEAAAPAPTISASRCPSASRSTARPHHRRAAAAADHHLVGPAAAPAARDHRSRALSSGLEFRARRPGRRAACACILRRPRRARRHPGGRRRHPLRRARAGRARIAADLRRLLHLARGAERSRSRAADAERNISVLCSIWPKRQQVITYPISGFSDDLRPGSGATTLSGIVSPMPRR